MITKVNEDRIKNLDNIPQELKELNNWVHVQFERDGKGNIKLKDSGKTNKLPYHVNGYRASHSKPSTWTNFNHCLHTFKNNNKKGHIEGLGCVLSMEHDYVFIDIDNIEENKSEKMKFINSFNSYTELSQSGKGYHIIVKVKYGKKEFEQWGKDNNLVNYSNKLENYHKNLEAYSEKLEKYHKELEDYEKLTDEEKEKAKEPKKPIKSKPTLSSKHGDYEIYIEKRFFWLTGDIVNNKSKIKEVDFETLRKTYEFIESHSTASMKAKTTKKKTSKVINLKNSPELTNDQIISICSKAKNKDKFLSLYNEEGQDGNSEGDQSLMNIFAFYTQDIEQLCDLMCESPRYRDKFDNHPTYLQTTAQKAIDLLDGKFYEGNSNKEYYFQDHNGKLKLDIDLLMEHLKTSDEHAVINTNELGFFVFKEGYYKQMTRNSICGLIRKHLHKSDRKVTMINEVCTQLSFDETNINELNKKDNIINLKNCLLEFDEKGNMCKKEHSQEEFITYMFNYNYNPNVVCNKWLTFLDETLPKDQQILLQEIIGYVLIHNNRAKKFFNFYGAGDTGKSVILRVLQKIVGRDLITSIPLQDICNPSLRFCVAGLYGKLINTCGDIPNKPLQDSGMLKMLTGDDLITAEKKGHDSFTFYNKAKMIFSMNQLPLICNDKTEAFYNRFVIIPFENVCPKEKRDRYLHDKFNIEGIINWSIDGLQRLLKNDLQFSLSEKNINIVNKYKKDNNNVLQFSEECLVKVDSDEDKTTNISTSEVYKAYKQFCFDNGYSPLGRNNFIKDMKIQFSYSENCISGSKRFRGFKNLMLSDEIKNLF